jgi:hypothetical protein
MSMKSVLATLKEWREPCAAQEIQVVSGGARGVDQAAMLGVLDAGGTALGVLADSLSKAAVNSKYRPNIREGRLLLVSSYDPDAAFNTGNAMGRNKYIYAFADYTLVVSSSVGKVVLGQVQSKFSKDSRISRFLYGCIQMYWKVMNNCTTWEQNLFQLNLGIIR